MSNLIETIPMIGVRGDVLIETRDAKTGKLAQRSEGHNLFTNYGLERFRKACAHAIGGQFGRNLYFDEAIIECEPGAAANTTSFGFLKYLFLTDNANAITAADSIIPGTLTGYATRDTYSGSDMTRGTINRNESLFTKDSLKAVFDFATDRANGTHKSVFWSDFASATYNNYASIDAVSNASLASNYSQIVESDDGYFYGCLGTTLYKIDPATLAGIATYTLPATSDAYAIFDVAGGYCYFTTAHNATTLYVFKLSDSTSTTKTLPAVFSTYGGAVIGGDLYYPVSGTTIYKYNLSAGTNSNIAQSQAGAYIRRLGNELYSCGSNGGQVYRIDYSTNTATATGCYAPEGVALCNTYSSTSKLWYKRQTNSYYDAMLNSQPVLLQHFNLTRTRANMITGRVLDTPITKDNTQTMKVTYTISFV